MELTINGIQREFNNALTLAVKTMQHAYQYAKELV